MKQLLCLAVLLFTLSGCAFSRGDASLPERDSIMAGEEITVEKNQNAYALAQQYKVPLRALIVLNDLRSPYMLRAGQRITLPIMSNSYGSGYSGIDAKPPQAAPAGSVISQPIDLGGSPASMSDDSVTSEPLAAPAAVYQEPAPVLAPAPQSKADPLSPSNITQQPRKVETTVAENSVARSSAATELTKAEPESQSASADRPQMEFNWPLQGTILSGFGPKDGGLNNDGINIAAPKGSPVSAAGGGIVVYAGNEMKGFGNLVLIRHEGGWVTAYAHLDRMMVTKDSVVAVGDMIGTVGSTGGVSAPQLHFETRLNGKPVDPQTVIKQEG